ncbi:MAG: MBL fold metallo-hydrolase [archaeon]
MIKLKALGGAMEVGRSSFLVSADDKILLDSGLKITNEADNVPENTGPLAPSETNEFIDAVIISHAHLDHSGNVPSLFHKTHSMTYMTPPTLEISAVLWHDSIKIAKLNGISPPFTKNEIEEVMNFAFPINYNRLVHITKNTSLELFNAGHILGSAMAKLYFKGKTLLYTGDFKDTETKLHDGCDFNVGDCDFLITETTYGNSNHSSRQAMEKAFLESIQETLDNGGTALVPAFAVGRSQEAIEVLHEGKIDAPIYLDGMGKKIVQTYFNFPEFFVKRKALKKAMNKVIQIQSQKQRLDALKQPSVIVTTAGMLVGGPVAFYLSKMYNDRKSKIHLTGYQVEGTPGRSLLETGRLIIQDKTVDVKAAVEKFDFSAHTGQKGILKLIKSCNPEKVVLVHGDPKVINETKLVIEKEGIETIAIKKDETIKLY